MWVVGLLLAVVAALLLLILLLTLEEFEKDESLEDRFASCDGNTDAVYLKNNFTSDRTTVSPNISHAS